MRSNTSNMMMQTMGLSGFFVILLHYVVEGGLLEVGFKLEKSHLFLHLYCSAGVTLTTLLFFGSFRIASVFGVFIFQFFFPLFGSVFTGALMISVFFSDKKNIITDFHEEDDKIQQNYKHDVQKSYYDAIQDNMNVEPLVEVMHSMADPDVKRGAIETLTNICSPEAIALLKECLSDQNVEVRFYASSGLSRVEEKLNAEIVLYKKKVEHGDRSIETIFNLGRAYFEFVYLRIQDESSLSYYINMAIECFEDVVSRPEATDYHRNLLQRVYTRAGRHEDARKLNENSHDPDAEKKDNLMYLAESYFKEGEMSKCKKLLSSKEFQEIKWDAVDDVKALWFAGSKKGSVL